MMYQHWLITGNKSTALLCDVNYRKTAGGGRGEGTMRTACTFHSFFCKCKTAQKKKKKPTKMDNNYNLTNFHCKIF